jgi:hypothetical protein
MAVEKWTGGSGQGLAWGSAFGTEINSIVNGNAILSTVSITNGTALDIFADISFVAGATITTAAPNYLGFYLYPLNEDAATYGDSRFGSSAAGPPPGNYWVGNIGFNAAASTTIYGVLSRIIIPPGTFSFVLYNGAGATLASSNTCKYRTYNRSVA